MKKNFYIPFTRESSLIDVLICSKAWFVEIIALHMAKTFLEIMDMNLLMMLILTKGPFIFWRYRLGRLTKIQNPIWQRRFKITKFPLFSPVLCRSYWIRFPALWLAVATELEFIRGLHRDRVLIAFILFLQSIISVSNIHTIYIYHGYE